MYSYDCMTQPLSQASKGKTTGARKISPLIVSQIQAEIYQSDLYPALCLVSGLLLSGVG